MIDTARGRVFVLALLLIGHTVLFPFYAQQPINPDAGVFPGDEDFIENPDQYIGERVVAGGFVQNVSPIVIEVETTQGIHNVTVIGTSLSPSIGDKVRVYGTLTAPRTIHSINAFVVPQGGLRYTWGVSVVAVIWVLLRLMRHWTMTLSQLEFSRRDTPLSARQVFATMMANGGDDDA